MKSKFFTPALLTVLASAFLFPLNSNSEKSRPISLSYNQIVAYLDQEIPISKSSDVDGQPRYMGQTKDNMAMLEIIGNKKNVSQITLMIGIPSDDQTVAYRNTAILLRFTKNALPEWEEAFDWITLKYKQVESSGKPEQIVRGNKLIKVSSWQGIGALVVTIKHKNISNSKKQSTEKVQVQKQLHWDLFDCTLLIVERKQQNWKYGDKRICTKMTKPIVDKVNSIRATHPIDVNSYEKNNYTHEDLNDPLCAMALQSAYLKHHYKTRKAEGNVVTYEYLARLWDSQFHDGAEWNDPRTLPYWRAVEAEMKIQGHGINY